MEKNGAGDEKAVVILWMRLSLERKLRSSRELPNFPEALGGTFGPSRHPKVKWLSEYLHLERGNLRLSLASDLLWVSLIHRINPSELIIN